MVDTAQPMAAETDPNVQFENAADAFKAFTTGEPVAQPRDDRGRFAAADDDDSTDDDDAAAAANDTSDDDDVDTADDDQGADDAHPDPADMPASWSKDDAELWEALPPEAQAKIAEREGERDRAVNQKFQEAANVRKEFDSKLTEANVNRDKYAAAIDEVLSFINPQAPDPRAYGAGTGNYDREGYDLARLNYEQSLSTLTQLQQQRQHIAAQQSQEMEQAEEAARTAIEEQWKPRFIAALPDITDPVKAPAAMQKLVGYAVENGIPQELFADERQARGITSAELLILEKARRYDEIQKAKGKVQEKPAPKPATPTAKPGTVTPRSAVQKAQANKARDRLAREGSIESGAAVWKQYL